MARPQSRPKSPMRRLVGEWVDCVIKVGCSFMFIWGRLFTMKLSRIYSSPTNFGIGIFPRPHWHSIPECLYMSLFFFSSNMCSRSGWNYPSWCRHASLNGIGHMSFLLPGACRFTFRYKLKCTEGERLGENNNLSMVYMHIPHSHSKPRNFPETLT